MKDTEVLATVAPRADRSPPPPARPRRRGWSIARATLVPLAGGALVAVSLPPLGWWPAAIVGIAVLARALEGRPWHGRLLAGFLAGIGQFAIGVAWALQFNAAGYVALVLAESLFVAAACALTPPGAGRVPALAGLLTLAELARDAWPFGGMPLGGIALGQVGGPLVPAARLGGPFLVAGVTFLAGAALGELARRPGRRTVAGGVAAALVVGAALGGTFAPAGGRPVRSIQVAIVQGGGRRGLDQLQVPASEVYDAALAPTETLSPGLQLVLWPEDVVALDGPLQGSTEERTLGALARRLRTTLLVGVTEPVGQTQFRNEIVAFAPSGHVVATFEKVHRVPFGEYVPLRGFFRHLANLSAVPRDAIPGTGTGMIETPAGRLAVLVSYEVFFPGRGRSGVRAGGQLIVLPTNTSSYSSSQAPTQEIAASRLQAVSQGRFLLQAAPTGFSAVISSSGDVLARSSLGTRDVIQATVPLLDGATLYQRWGDLPVLLLALLAALAGWARAWPNRRPGRRPTY